MAHRRMTYSVIPCRSQKELHDPCYHIGPRSLTDRRRATEFARASLR